MPEALTLSEGQLVAGQFAGLWGSYIAVCVVWAITVVSPGPNFLATCQASLARDRKAGLLVAAGIAVGTTIWAAASLFGLGLLFETAAWLYLAVKVIGAGYLIFVGLKLLVSAQGSALPGPASAPALPPGRAFRHGLLTDLSNPKAAAFFTSLFAVAVPPDSPLWFQGLLVFSVVAIAVGWYGLVACAMATARARRLYQRAAETITTVMGLVFVGLGVKLALAR